MNARVDLLRQLVADGLYVIDEAAVAEAVLLRANARWAVPGWSAPQSAARRTRRSEPIRSFRPHAGARSFRLCRATRRPQHARPDGISAY